MSPLGTATSALALKRCPLLPQHQTSIDTLQMSVKGHKATYAAQQRTRGKRPGGCAAKKSDEIPSPHRATLQPENNNLPHRLCRGLRLCTTAKSGGRRPVRVNSGHAALKLQGPLYPPKQTSAERIGMSASLVGRLGSSTFRLSTAAVSMSLTGSCFSSESAPRPFHHGIRRRGGAI